MAHKLFARQVKHFGIFLFRLFSPLLKSDGTDNLFGQVLIVKLNNQFIVDQDIQAPGLMFKIANFPNKLLVMSEKRCLCFKFSVDQCLSNKEFAA